MTDGQIKMEANDAGTDLSNPIPRVSIVLPTYNRARFLPQAIASIAQQTYRDWELIVVDDGGTDESEELIAELSRNLRNRVKYLRQNNQGPGVARNFGIENARGEYVAFFDSDDTWESGHLELCVSQLDKNPDVDWVYCNFRRVRLSSGEVIDANVFQEGARREKFLSLKVEKRGDLHVIHDFDVLRCSLEHGLCIGLRTSVVRRNVFEKVRFPNFRVGEDQVLYPRAISCGVEFGYLMAVSATAYVHDQNISEVAGVASIDKYVRSLRELIRAFESIRDLPLTFHERRALERRIADECFWNLGYACLLEGRDRDALEYFVKGLLLCPSDIRFWKTYVIASLRIALRGVWRRLSGCLR